MFHDRVLKDLTLNDNSVKDFKEIKILQDKIGKIQVNFQKVIKEKSFLTSEMASKDREFSNLQKKYENLLGSLEKADKIAHNYVDKACKADTFEKKLAQKNSTSTKLKEIADKKLLVENQVLNGKISLVKVSKVELERARKEVRSMQKELEKSCESFETQRVAYLDRINGLESELEVELEKFKAFKEEKNSEISQIQKNIVFLNNQKQELTSELSRTKQKQSEIHQKMEAEKNSKFNLKEENQTLQQEIQNLKNIVQKLSSQAELSGQKLIELNQEKESCCLEIAQEKMMRSKQTECLEKEMEILKKELHDARIHNSQNEANFKSLLEKEKLISAGLSQKTKDQSESISVIQNKFTACVADLEHERAEYKTNLSILKSSHEKSEKDFLLQIGQLKEQLNEMNDNTIKKEEYYQSLLTEEKEINAGLSVKVHDQTSKIGYMEEYLEMMTVQNKKEVEDLNYELNNLESKYGLSQNELSQVTLKIQNLEGVLTANESTHSDETANMQSRISDLEFLKGKLNAQVQESQNLIQEQNMVIQKLEDSLNDKTVNAQSLSQKCHTMEVEMKDLMKRFTTNKIVFEEEKNSHEQTKQISVQRISALEKEISEVNQNSTDKEKLMQSLLESEKEKRRKLSSQNSDLESKIDSLEEDLKSTAQNHGDYVQSMQKELADMNVKNDELSKNITMLEMNISIVKDEYQSMKDAYNSMEALLTSNVNSLEEKNNHLLAELSVSSSDNAGKTQMIEMLEKMNLEKDATISNIQDQLYLSNEELKSHLERNGKLELELKESIENYQKAADSYEKNVHSLMTDASDLKREKIELLSKISELETEFIELRDIVKEKNTAAKSLEDKISYLNNTIEGMQVKTTDLEKHVAVLESSHEGKAVELERKLQSSKADAQMLEKVVSEKDIQIIELDEKILEKNVIISDLEAEVKKSTHYVQSLEENIEANKQLFSDTQERLIASISQLNVQIQERQNDIILLQDKLDSSIKECDEAQARSLELNNLMQTQSAQVLEIENKLQNAARAIADLQKETENNLIHIKRSDDKISELVDKNQKLNQLNEASAQCEKNLRDEIKDSKKIYCELESKSQSQIEDYQAELEELHELLVRDREEYKLERKYFNDQMTALTGQLNREIVLKENEMTLCKDLSDKLDKLKKEKNELESRVKEISSKCAEEELAMLENLKEQVASLNAALDFKSKMLKDLESQMEDCQSRLSVAELRLLNELSSKEMHFKSFEDRLKSKCSEVENLTKSHLEMKKNLLKVKEENKNLLSEYEKSKASIARYKEVERLVLLEKKNLESGHKDSVSQVDKYKKEISNLKALVKDLTESNSEISQLYTTQAELISSQGALNSLEMEKISNLNAELVGHSNYRQKIKYVSNIKQENLMLRKENSNLLIERDHLSQRIQSLLDDKACLGPII